MGDLISAQYTPLVPLFSPDYLLETDAQALGISLLYVEASLTAQPFFSHKGFRVIREQSKDLRGCQFTQFYMEKRL